MKTAFTDPELNTCFFCCKWRKGNLFVCETCIIEKRMSNYHFLLCKDCSEVHSKNHIVNLKPRFLPKRISTSMFVKMAVRPIFRRCLRECEFAKRGVRPAQTEDHSILWWCNVTLVYSVLILHKMLPA